MCQPVRPTFGRPSLICATEYAAHPCSCNAAKLTARMVIPSKQVLCSWLASAEGAVSASALRATPTAGDAASLQTGLP